MNHPHTSLLQPVSFALNKNYTVVVMCVQACSSHFCFSVSREACTLGQNSTYKDVPLISCEKYFGAWTPQVSIICGKDKTTYLLSGRDCKGSISRNHVRSLMSLKQNNQ